MAGKIDIKDGVSEQKIVDAAAQFNRLRSLAYSASGFKSIQNECIEIGLKMFEDMDPQTVGAILIQAGNMK